MDKVEPLEHEDPGLTISKPGQKREKQSFTAMFTRSRLAMQDFGQYSIYANQIPNKSKAEVAAVYTKYKQSTKN